MSGLANISNNILGLMHGQSGMSVPKPFGQDIFLYETHVAGTTHVEGIEELEPFLNVGDKLDLFREPDNPYDELAVVVRTKSGVKIGYIPRAHNAVFARLMDAGKLIFAEISDKEKVETWHGVWIKLNMKIYMHD